MSLRPRAGAPDPGRGGDGRRRRWSESPIPRVASRRVRMVGPPAVDPPLYWWHFDETTGTALTSDTSMSTGAALVLESAYGLIHAQPPLAPGSTYSVEVELVQDDSWTTALAPAADGFIVFDLWLSGLKADPGFPTTTWDVSAIGSFGILSEDGDLGFLVDSAEVHREDPAPSTSHVVWRVNPATGAMTISINDSEVYTTAGSGALNWDDTVAWQMTLYSEWGTQFDELKVYGVEATPA